MSLVLQHVQDLEKHAPTTSSFGIQRRLDRSQDLLGSLIRKHSILIVPSNKSRRSPALDSHVLGGFAKTSQNSRGTFPILSRDPSF